MSELQRIIAQGEGQQLDFKFRIDDKRRIAHTLAAYANTNGGKLLIGVKDNGKIKGVNPEEEYYMIEGAAHAHCRPEVQFTSKVWQEEHLLVLEIDIEKSEMKHKAEDDDGKWRYYMRVDDQTLVANKIIERVWKLEKFGQRQPSEFDESTSQLLQILREDAPVRISGLYKRSDLKMNEVDKRLAQLVFWKVVAVKITEAGTYYTLGD